MHSEFLAREVVREDSVAEDCDQYCEDYTWFPDSYRALEWLLARLCHSLSDSVVVDKKKGIHTYKQDRVGKALPIWVNYHCNDTTVTIHNIDIETP